MLRTYKRERVPLGKELLEVENLSIHFGANNSLIRAVNGVAFSVAQGETVVLVGESGSGKSLSALAIPRLLPPAAQVVAGDIFFKSKNLFELPEYKMREMRGGQIGMIFQDPQNSLNPVMTISEQIEEPLRLSQGLKGRRARHAAIALLEDVGIEEASTRAFHYPHQFSGGMKQRVMIAIALAGKPELLIADEPTTALDVTVQAQVLDLLKSVQKKRDMGMLFITHDLAVAHQLADRLVVLRAGEVVESNTKNAFYSAPKHPYSKNLLEALPTWEKRVEEGYGNLEIKGETVLKVRNLKVWFPIRKGVFRRIVNHVKAVDGVDIGIREGSTLAVVGESGSGKTTMAKAILRLLKKQSGEVKYLGQDLGRLSGRQLRSYRRELQIVFQDPYSSLNPRITIGSAIKEGMVTQQIETESGDLDMEVSNLLTRVGLPPDYALRYPHEFSGGERQRICIARALAVKPKLLVCDEPTSALDVSVQSQILRLFRELQDSLGLTYLFVTHNLGVVSYLAHQVAVMYKGRVVEYGDVRDVLETPKDPYTQRLVEAVPTVGKNV